MPTKENTVLLTNLLQYLKLYWFHDKQFNLTYQNNNELRSNGSALIALVSDDNKENTILYVEDLKHNDEIIKKRNSLQIELINILEDTLNLSDEIKKKLIDI